uniref:Mediator of RNA polymerase II transcription subunit 9 n=1 Tax=Oncorhynchus mykiss TaxID=8022 RepID=A0A8C7UQI2_ONCMY
MSPGRYPRLYLSLSWQSDHCSMGMKSMDKDSMDVNQELTKLKTKIQETREKILAMPEIESSPGEQQDQLKTMREKVDTKTQLLQKYKGLCVFDSPKS